MHDKEAEGTPGGLLFGTSFVYPGKVGDEYFMTKGHFHAKRDTAEYYFCISGRGALILMTKRETAGRRRWSAARSTTFRAPFAHRLANTGEEVLAVGCCWGADCGHRLREHCAHGLCQAPAGSRRRAEAGIRRPFADVHL